MKTIYLGCYLVLNPVVPGYVRKKGRSKINMHIKPPAEWSQSQKCVKHHLRGGDEKEILSLTDLLLVKQACIFNCALRG